MAALPRESPHNYSSLVTIAFGPDRRCRQISRNCLLDLPWLKPEKDFYEFSLDDEIGKTLLHYLRTEEYQAPWTDLVVPDRIRLWLDIRSALQILFGAEIWPLPKLRRIIRGQIQTLSNTITICDLVELVDEELSKPNLPILTSSRQWLYNHLSNALEKASHEDSGVLDELMEFIDFRDLSLYKELTKRIIRFLDKRTQGCCTENSCKERDHSAYVK